MARSMQASWRRIGLAASFVIALLPVLVALLHLLPPAVHAEPKAHHQHARHAGLVYDPSPAAEYQTPDTPRDGDSRSSVGHCPLCFWLQGFHALPTPDVVAATPLRSGTARALPWHESDFVLLRLSSATQPRAPPIALPVA